MKIKKIPLWSIGLIIGIALLICGVMNGQLTEIYRKAVVICIECIGIG